MPGLLISLWGNPDFLPSNDVTRARPCMSWPCCTEACHMAGHVAGHVAFQAHASVSSGRESCVVGQQYQVRYD